MSLQSIISTFTERLWEQHDKSVIDDIFSEDFVGHNLSDSAQEVMTLDDFRNKVTALFDAFSDMTYQIDEVIEQGSRAAMRWHSEGTWTGAYGDHQPSAQPVRLSGVFIIHVESGLIKQAFIIDTTRQLVSAQ